MASAIPTVHVMGVALTAIVKWLLFKIVSLLTCVFCRLSVAFVTFAVSVVS